VRNTDQVDFTAKKRCHHFGVICAPKADVLKFCLFASLYVFTVYHSLDYPH